MSKFAKNLSHLRKLKGFSQEALADDININRSRIGSYEEGRSQPPVEMLVLFSEYFGLPIDVLVKNDLSKTNEKGFIQIGQHRVLFPVVVDNSNEDVIEVIPMKASAGYLNGYADPEYMEQLEHIKLPFIPTGKHRAFPIKGDSMLPLKEGSWVIGKFVEDVRDIRSGRTYVLLVKDEGIVYKRVLVPEDDPETLLLKSDNKVYQTYPVKLEDVLEIWEFTCSIRTEEYDADELKVESIMRMLRDLQVELRPLVK